MIAIDTRVMVKGLREPGIVKGYYNSHCIVVWDEPPTALPSYTETHGNKALVVFEDTCTPC